VKFPDGVYLFPATSGALSTVGYDVYGCTLDEANYLEVVDKSKRALQGVGERFDAAKEAMDEVMSRIKGRFYDGLKTHGLLVMISNPRYKKDFLDRVVELVSRGKQSELKFLPPTMVRRRNAWEPRPKELISKTWFVLNTDTMKIVDKGLEAVMRAKYPEAV